VKLRGIRIEPGEIEEQLRAVAGVADAAVVVQSLANGSDSGRTSPERLVAWVTRSAEHKLDTSQLREVLVERLPEYMVPSVIRELDAMPLTVSGKLDRKALPRVELSDLQAAYEAPQGEVEQTLAAIWQELLSVEQVGRNDGFFELGGHSMLAMQLAVRVREHFEVDLPLATMFHDGSLVALAQAVIDLQVDQFDSDEVNRILAELSQLSEADLKKQLEMN